MVTVRLGGQDRTVQFPWPVIRRLDADCGINLYGVSGETLVRPDTLTKLLWAGLLTDWPEVTVGMLDGLLALSTIGPIALGVAQAIKAAMPEDEQSPPPPSPAA